MIFIYYQRKVEGFSSSLSPEFSALLWLNKTEGHAARSGAVAFSLEVVVREEWILSKNKDWSLTWVGCVKWVLEELLMSSRLCMFFGVFSWWLCTFFFFLDINGFVWIFLISGAPLPISTDCCESIHPYLRCAATIHMTTNQFSLHPPTSCAVLLCASCLYSFPTSFSFVAHFSQSPSIEPYSHIGSFSTAHELSDLKHMLVRLQVTEYLISVSHKIDDQN